MGKFQEFWDHEKLIITYSHTHTHRSGLSLKGSVSWVLHIICQTHPLACHWPTVCFIFVDVRFRSNILVLNRRVRLWIHGSIILWQAPFKDKKTNSLISPILSVNCIIFQIYVFLIYAYLLRYICSWSSTKSKTVIMIIIKK